MAEFGNPKYDLSIKYATAGTTSTKTKSLNVINYNATGSGGGESALGLDVDSMFDFAALLNDSIIGGVVLEYTFNEGRVLTDG